MPCLAMQAPGMQSRSAQRPRWHEPFQPAAQHRTAKPHRQCPVRIYLTTSQQMHGDKHNAGIGDRSIFSSAQVKDCIYPCQRRPEVRGIGTGCAIFQRLIN